MPESLKWIRAVDVAGYLLLMLILLTLAMIIQHVATGGLGP